MRIRPFLSLAAATGACALLSGCVDPQKPMQRDYGWAVRSNIAAQTADPDAKYARRVDPAASGDRAAAASERYEKGQVIEPSIESTR